MSALSAEREIWQQRAGAFYPLVVAAQAQTRLPVAGRLIPSEEDLGRSLCWMPAVGVALGVVWAFVAAAAVEIGLSPLASAALVVVMMVTTGGLFFERALATTAASALGRWRHAMGHGAEGDDALLATVSVVCLAITVRTAALAQVSPDEFTAALIAAAVLSRWVISLGPLILAVRSSKQELQELLRYVLIAASVAIVMALCQGVSGLVLMVLAGAAMFFVARKSETVAKTLPKAAGLALVVEVLVLLGQ